MDTEPFSLDNLILITGGAKSGKSTLAESLAIQEKSNVYYVATMPRIKDDEELSFKINEHRKRRPANWTTIEKETLIELEIEKLKNVSSTLIVDCLSTYVSNIMLGEDKESSYEEQSERMFSNLKNLAEVLLSKDKIRFIVVTNEVGWSIVPENKSARLYRDLLGAANQYMSKSANQVFLCVSGITLKIKPALKETQS